MSSAVKVGLQQIGRRSARTIKNLHVVGSHVENVMVLSDDCIDYRRAVLFSRCSFRVRQGPSSRLVRHCWLLPIPGSIHIGPLVSLKMRSRQAAAHQRVNCPLWRKADAIADVGAGVELAGLTTAAFGAGLAAISAEPGSDRRSEEQ
jgi:hypothetical protein